MWLDTELYKVFYHVAKSQSISSASKELLLSQPAVSKSIKKLEEQSGCTLFIRHPRGVKLTTEGEVLFSHVRLAFGHLEKAEKVLKKLSALESGRVKIGISNTVCKYYFMPKLETFHKMYPDIRIQIINTTSAESLKLLAKGDIDFTIMTYMSMVDGFEYYQLGAIHDIFVSSTEYNEPVGIETLCRMPLMLIDKESQVRSYVDNYLIAQGYEIKPEIELGSMDFLVEFAAIGLGVACVMKEFVAKELEEGELYEIPLTQPIPPRKLGIALQENIPLTAAATKFFEYLQEIPSE